MSKQNNPAWVPVDSSAISDIAYDAGTETLCVKFKPNGTAYAYSNVTKSEHAALVGAESLGKHFNQHIKLSHPYVKLEVV